MTKIEYRIMSKGPAQTRYAWAGYVSSLDYAYRRIDHWRRSGPVDFEYRVDERTVTYGPWRPVDGE